MTIAFHAIAPGPFAFAARCAALHKERAFQASSPKTYTAALRGGFFLFVSQGLAAMNAPATIIPTIVLCAVAVRPCSPDKPALLTPGIRAYRDVAYAEPF